MSVLAEYLGYSFVREAFVVGVLIAVASSLVGLLLVLKRMSFTGDAMSHVAFAGAAVSSALGFALPIALVYPLTFAATWGAFSSERKGKGGDASLAVASVLSLAAGYTAMNVFASGGNVSGDVCSQLFGSTSILTLGTADLLAAVGLSAGVVLSFAAWSGDLFGAVFDPDFAKAADRKRAAMSEVLLVALTSAVVVVGQELVGALLIAALLILPGLTAMEVCVSYRGTLIATAAVSAACAVLGIAFSIVFSTPVGCTVIIANGGAYALAKVASLVKRKVGA